MLHLQQLRLRVGENQLRQLQQACLASTGHVSTNGRILQTNGWGNATTTTSTAKITPEKLRKFGAVDFFGKKEDDSVAAENWLMMHTFCIII